MKLVEKVPGGPGGSPIYIYEHNGHRVRVHRRGSWPNAGWMGLVSKGDASVACDARTRKSLIEYTEYVADRDDLT